MSKFFPFFALTLFLGIFTSCSTESMDHVKDFIGVHDEPAPPAPLAIFIAQDMSGSRKQNGIPLLSENDLDHFVAMVQDSGRGGKIGFLIIDDSSKDEPVVPLNIHYPERPVKPTKSKNVASQSKQLKKYKADMLAYQRDSAAYSLQNASEIAHFKQEVLRRLRFAENHPPKGTDVISALNSASLFLNEGNPNAKQAAIFLSDGIDNQKGKVISQPEGSIEFIWVSGIPIQEGIPAHFRTATKTSVSDAIDHISPITK